jgi:hypothetical protein
VGWVLCIRDSAGAGPGELGDRTGQFVKRAVALDDPAEVKRPQPGRARRCGEFIAQAVQVQPDRLSGAGVALLLGIHPLI